MWHQVVLGVLCATAISSPLNTTHAVEALSAKEFAVHCKALPDDRNSVGGQYCNRYIQGFIDGAVATEVRVRINVEAELGRKESFGERAMRTRGRDIRRAAGYAEYCPGDPVPLSEVVETITVDLAGRGQLAPEVEANGVPMTQIRTTRAFRAISKAIPTSGYNCQ